MCMSRNLSMAPDISLACSISSWDNRLMNHSNERWSRFIQKKSTYKKWYIWCKLQISKQVTRIRIPKIKFRLCRQSFGIRMPRLEEISCAGRLQNKSRQVRKSARAKSVWKKHDSRTHDEWPQGWHREIISRSTDGRLFFFGGQWHRTAHLRASL